jgi:hypothetical protein
MSGRCIAAQRVPDGMTERVQQNAAGGLGVSPSYELPAVSSWLIVSEWATKGVETRVRHNWNRLN